MNGVMIPIALYQLLVLHNIDGREVYVNPSEIISLREAKADIDTNKVFVKGLRCMVNTTDGKFLNVIEECAYIRTMISNEIKRLQEFEQQKQE